MRHTLRKYLSNRGSALFMVLSTMTALLISCTAMYFSVVSSRSTQYAVFYQQQSYQSATSLADAVMASIVSGSGGFEDDDQESGGFSLIFEDTEMTEGESYTFGDDQEEYAW